MSVTLQLTANFGSNQTNVAYQFRGPNGGAVGNVISAGVNLIAGLTGLYTVSVSVPDDGTVSGVAWSCADISIDDVYEDLDDRIREAKNLDAAISSRNSIAPDNAGIAAIYARTDVATSTRSSHSPNDIWSVTGRSLTSFGTLVSDIAFAVWNAITRTTTNPQLSIKSIQMLEDADKFYALSLLDAPSTGSTLIIPGPNENEDSLCVVYVNTEALDNSKREGIKVQFELNRTPAKSERLLELKVKTLITNSEGYGQIILQRTDKIIPAGSQYRVVSQSLGLDQMIELKTPTFNLADLI